MPQPQATDGGSRYPTSGQGCERIFCLLKRTGLVDTLEVSHLALLLPGNMLGGIADQVDNAQLHLSLRVKPSIASEQ